MFKDYILQNWILILILAAFAISLRITVFLEKKTIRRMYVLIVSIFLLSIVVFEEFYLADLGAYPEIRTICMAIRYSATPLIIAQVAYTLVEKARWFVFIPAIVLTVINFVSIFTGIVFRIAEDSTLERGPLGYLPYIGVAVYSFFLISILLRRCNKQPMEIIPIAFLGFALISGVILPLVFGSDYSRIFCSTIAAALYIFYEFTVLMLTKKDSLTGLLNRQTYYADISNNPEDITAVVSMDMNGLKMINDNDGHTAGDEALTTLANCFTRSLKHGQKCYRLGGDEFVIVCRKNSLDEIIQLVECIRDHIGQTKYSCAIGYSYGAKTIEDMVRESDEMMYEEKADYYRREPGHSQEKRRHLGGSIAEEA